VEISAIASPVRYRSGRGEKNYTSIKQINCDNQFLEMQFVFLNHTKKHK